MDMNFTKDDLFTMAVAVHTIAEIYRAKEVPAPVQAEIDRVDELLKPYRINP